jgi:hypothetical protein
VPIAETNINSILRDNKGEMEPDKEKVKYNDLEDLLESDQYDR